MFEAPKVMLSDNGNEFINQKVEEFLRKFGVKHRLTATYKPRTSGQTERLNAVLGQVVRKIAEKNPLDLDEMLPGALMALRSKVNEAHGKTPFEMVFGKKMRIPTEVAVKEPTEEKH
jgi:transposase InsO family protein